MASCLCACIMSGYCRVPFDHTRTDGRAANECLHSDDSDILLRAVDWAPMLKSQNTTLHSVNFLPDRESAATGKPLLNCTANYKYPMACRVGMDGLGRWLKVWGANASSDWLQV